MSAMTWLNALVARPATAATTEPAPEPALAPAPAPAPAPTFLAPTRTKSAASTSSTANAAASQTGEARARTDAAAEPGQALVRCDVCFEDVATLAPRVCVNAACSAKVCSGCAREWIKGFVESTAYFISVPKCMGCNTRVPTPRWAKLTDVDELLAAYKLNLDRILTIRCSSCESNASFRVPDGQLERNSERRSELLAAELARLPVEGQRAVRLAAAKYMRYAISGKELLAELVAQEGLELTDFWRTWRVARLIPDAERRATFVSAVLDKFRVVLTPCCSLPVCWACKRVEDEHTCGEEDNAARSAEGAVQQCPGCSVYVIKTEGCNSITCVCGEEWTWDGDGY